jgi:hypothetical protein
MAGLGRYNRRGGNGPTGFETRKIERGETMKSVMIKLKNRTQHEVRSGSKPIKRDGERLYVIGASSKACVSCKTAGLERQHCVIRISGTDVFLHDLVQRGDVKVNDEVAPKVSRLLPGDRVSVADLVLDIGIHRRGEPEVKSGLPADSETEISQWLMDEDERAMKERLAHPTSRTVDAKDLTSDLPIEIAPAEVAETAAPAATNGTRFAPMPDAKSQANDSVEAAADMLNKMFKPINFRR